MTSGLLRACRTVPDWASWGGRPSPYAIEWVGQGSGTERYTLATHHFTGMSAVTIWFKKTSVMSNGFTEGLFGIYDTPQDIFSININGNAGGNDLEFMMGATSLFTVNNIGTNWHNITLSFNGPSSTELWFDGGLLYNGMVGYVGPANAYTLGMTTPPAPTPEHYLSDCIVDEIAFFDVPMNGHTLYNSGTPLQYTNYYPNLVASYEVERATGSIMPNSIMATYYPAPAGAFIFGGTTTGIVEVVTSGLASSDWNPLAAMSEKYKDWVYGTAVSSRYPLGAGIDLTVEACGLMPYPAGGGFSTLTYAGAYIGNEDLPDATPHMSKTTTMASGDSTAYAAMGGSNSLTGVTDARAGRLFLPRFVKR
jgi:hypothetical protein